MNREVRSEVSVKRHVVLTRDGTQVLARINDTVQWQDLQAAECVGHRYTIEAPSFNAACAMATTYDGKPGTIDAHVKL